MLFCALVLTTIKMFRYYTELVKSDSRTDRLTTTSLNTVQCPMPRLFRCPTAMNGEA